MALMHGEPFDGMQKNGAFFCSKVGPQKFKLIEMKSS